MKETNSVTCMSTLTYGVSSVSSRKKKKRGCLNIFVNYLSNPGIQILYVCRAHMERRGRYREFLIKMQSQQDLKYTALKYKARTLLSKLSKFSEHIQGVVMVSEGSL